jgi:Zn-dependent protease with chaperone function
VLTDAMVERAGKMPAGSGDTALLGVLAHEIGHVQYRHTTRMVVEQGVLQVGLGLALGDVSTLVSSGASLLTGLSYRRAHEAEADCYAIALMHAAGLPTAPLADLLAGVEAETQAHADVAAAQPGTARSSDASPRTTSPGRWDWLSTHPDTAGRAELLRQGQLCR